MSGERKRPEPFDRSARRRARDRAARLLGERTEILRFVEEEMMARAEMGGPVPAGPELRIGLLLPPPPDVIGADPSFDLARRHGGIQCDEDRLPFADAAFARISCLMTLHGVNDLPGALLLMRRALKPGGRIVAAFPAGIVLGHVRQAFLQADMAGEGAAIPRVGPTVDPAGAASLLARAGFVDPVAEVQEITVRGADLMALARDIRAHGDSGWLTARSRQPTTRSRWALAAANLAASCEDPHDRRLTAHLELLFLSARCPEAAG